MNEVKIPNKMSDDLAYICGVLAGDGSINVRLQKHDYEIKCVGNPKDEKEYYKQIIVPLIYNLFNINVEAKYYDKGTTFGVRIWSKKLVIYLNSLGLPIGKKYNKLRIPEIFNRDERLVSNFIQGLADTDFGLSLKKKGNSLYPVIVGSSNTRGFMEEVGFELDKRGLRPLKYFDCIRKDCRFKKGYAVIHRLELNGNLRLKRWIETIGFRHPKHNKKIDLLKNKYSGSWNFQT